MKPGDELINLLDQKLLFEHLPTSSRILVAVSGGADSVALLRALSALSTKHAYFIQAVHVNHGLRPTAIDDQHFVESLCTALKVPIAVCQVNGSKKPAQTSPEQFWRQLRYSEFSRVMRETKCQYLALGHTADDLVETFLYHLTRGTGLAGLAFKFLNTVNGITIIRPLWKTSRVDIEKALESNCQHWICDPTNDEIRYSRNLIRHKIMPVLRQINPAAADAILNLSQDISDKLIRNEILPGLTVSVKDASIRLEQIREPGDAELLRRFVQVNAGAILDRRQTAHAMHMISSKATGTVALTKRKTLIITQDLAWIYPGAEPADQDIAAYHTKVFGGVFATLDSRTSIISVNQSFNTEGLDGTCWKVINDFISPVNFRNRLPGDRVGSKTTSKLMIEFRVPWYLRDYVIWALDTSGKIVGVVGLEDLQKWFARRNSENYSFSYTKSPSSA